ncbi:MAG: RNA polymerase-binding protein DksA [Gammaproteobacteria bacterium]|nr:RNA polymerase-binding protein DksA [Gammaproteobacteria bacterium]
MVEESDLPPGYRPGIDEPYMGPRQLTYFRHKLIRWRAELVQETQSALEQMRDEGYREVGDEVDRANQEADQSIDLRTRDRYRKLIAKIDAALDRIDDGSYGFCLETHEPIGIARLEARPVATLSVGAQERHELRERQMAKHR